MAINKTNVLVLDRYVKSQQIIWRSDFHWVTETQIHDRDSWALDESGL